MNIFITGGTTGIGLALAEAYLKIGHKVGLCGRDLTKLPAGFQQQYNDNLQCYTADVVDRELMNSIIKEFTDWCGGVLDVVVANAGRSIIEKTSLPDFGMSRQIIDTNIHGVQNAFEAGLNVMLPRSQGHLVAISSVSAYMGLPGTAAYCASKSAVHSLCESYAIDFKIKGITVSSICPGFVDTPLTSQNDYNMPFIMTPEKSAGYIMNAIKKKKIIYIFPWQMRFVVFTLSMMPRWLYRYLMGRAAASYTGSASMSSDHAG